MQFLAIALSVLPRFTDSDCPFGIFWPLYCLFFVDLLILLAPLVSFGHCIFCSWSIYWFLLPFGIFWPLYCLFFVDLLILIIPLVSFGHCIVCSSSIYWFWLPFWYLLAIVLSVLRRFTDSDCPFGIFWPLYCLFFVDLLILIAPLVSFGHCLFFVDLLILIAPLVSFGHCIVCSSSIYWFWLSLWYLLAIVLSVLRRFTDSDCLFGIVWPLYFLFFDRQYNGQKIPKV
jgi:predicted nucleic acid-binding Zn ribbon protein